MKTFVVYDTTHGNTEQIAQAIGDVLGAPVRRAADVSPGEFESVDLLVVGSPTHGGHPTEGIDGLLKASPVLAGVKIAVFDTRTASFWNRLLPFGYAAPRLARALEGQGGTLLAPPEGFVVLGIKGPLRDGELERAAAWATGLLD
jgi:flavodoxin